MTLVPVDPWRLLDRWQNELERASRFPKDEQNALVTSDWSPAVDIREESDRYLLHADIPGVKPEQIEVSADDGMLTIKGERRHESTEEKGDYKRVERSHGVFYRRFALPDDVDPEKISASTRDGVLELTLPKSEGRKPRKIEVKG